MKLFVWEDVLEDHSLGIMFAVAPNLNEAKKALLKKCSYLPKNDLNKQPQEFDLSESVGFYLWGGS
jgi:hypothetical protein